MAQRWWGKGFHKDETCKSLKKPFCHSRKHLEAKAGWEVLTISVSLFCVTSDELKQPASLKPPAGFVHSFDGSSKCSSLSRSPKQGCQQHPKMNFLSSFTCPPLVTSLPEFLFFSIWTYFQLLPVCPVVWRVCVVRFETQCCWCSWLWQWGSSPMNNGSSELVRQNQSLMVFYCCH